MCVIGAVVPSYCICVASLSTSIGKEALPSFLPCLSPTRHELRPANQVPRQHAMAALGLALVLACPRYLIPTRRRRRNARLWRSQPFGASPFQPLCFVPAAAYCYLPSRSALTSSSSSLYTWACSWQRCRQEARCKKRQHPMPTAPGLEACPCLSVRPRCVCSCLKTCRLGVLAEHEAAGLCCASKVP